MMSQLKLHPTTLLLAWMGLAIALSWFEIPALLLASAAIFALMWAIGVARCWRLVRRTRILLLTLLLVYAFAMPGTPLIAVWDQAYPSAEGLAAGLRQVWRLMLMIVALATLLAYLSREQLLAGIYTLLLPIKSLGVPVAQFSVRLWLTLLYVEATPKSEGLSARWANAMSLPSTMESSISLEVPKFSHQDALFAIGYAVLLGWALW